MFLSKTKRLSLSTKGSALKSCRPYVIAGMLCGRTVKNIFDTVLTLKLYNAVNLKTDYVGARIFLLLQIYARKYFKYIQGNAVKRAVITERRGTIMIKWIFFDVGSTLVDETKAYDHRALDMISNTDITFEEFNDARIAFAKLGLDGNSAAIKCFGLTKTPWHSEDEIPYSDAHSTLQALCDKGYHLGIIANQDFGTAERLEHWNLRQFSDVIVSSAEIGYAKPDKEIFEKAFELAVCRAEESVMSVIVWTMISLRLKPW